jgi:hypothetical protein
MMGHDDAAPGSNATRGELQFPIAEIHHVGTPWHHSTQADAEYSARGSTTRCSRTPE